MSQNTVARLSRKDTSPIYMYLLLLKFGCLLLVAPIGVIVAIGGRFEPVWITSSIGVFAIYAIVAYPIAVVMHSVCVSPLPRQIAFNGTCLVVEYGTERDGNQMRGSYPVDKIRYRVGTANEDEVGSFLGNRTSVIIDIPSIDLRPKNVSAGWNNGTVDEWIAALEKAGVPIYRQNVPHRWQTPILFTGVLLGGISGNYIAFVIAALGLVNDPAESNLICIVSMAISSLLASSCVISLDRCKIDRDIGGFAITFLHIWPRTLVFPVLFGLYRNEFAATAASISCGTILILCAVVFSYFWPLISDESPVESQDDRLEFG